MNNPFRRTSFRVALLLPLTALFVALGLMDRTLFRRYSEDAVQTTLETRCRDLSREATGRLRQRFETSGRLVQSTLAHFRSHPAALRDERFCRETFVQQLRYCPSAHMIYYGLEDDSFVGVLRENDGSFSFAHAEPSPAPPAAPLRTFAPIDPATGEPGVPAPRAPYKATSRPWYSLAKANPDSLVWSDVYFFAATPEFGITASRAIRSPSGEVLGVLAVDDSLARLGEFLREILPTPNARMFIVETKSNAAGGHDLVAASSDVPLLRLREDGWRLRVDAADCADPLLRGAVAWMKTRPGRLSGVGEPVLRRISLEGRDYMLLLTPYSDDVGPGWHFI